LRSASISRREDELPVELAPGQEIEAQDHRGGNIIDIHRALPEPARPVAVFGGHRAVPIRNKPSRAQCNDLHKAVLSVILRDQFSENLAAAVPRIRPVDAGGGDVNDLTDAGGRGSFENLEGAAHIEVEEIVSVFLAAIFVDAVPGGDVDDAVASRGASPSASSGPERTPR